MSWEKDGKVPFIGLGTGRCGTNSLVHILNSCKNVEVTKNGFPVPWYGPPSKELIDHFNNDGYQGKVVGDVSEWLLPHVAAIRREHEELKVVCLHRPKEETVESMLKHVERFHRPHDQLLNRNRKWVHMYPVIDAATEKQAFEFFWEFYEMESRAITGDVLHMEMNDLNRDDSLVQLFDFLTIPADDRNIPDDLVHDPFKTECVELHKKLREQEAANG